MKKIGILTVLFLGLLSFATERLPGPFEDMARQYEAAVNEGDLKTLQTFYDARSTIFTPDGQVVEGTFEIQTYLETLVALTRVVGPWKVAVEEVEITGKYAYELGSYSLSTTDDEVTPQGRYLIVWRQTDQGWVVHREIGTLPTDIDLAELKN